MSDPETEVPVQLVPQLVLWRWRDSVRSHAARGLSHDGSTVDHYVTVT